MYAIVDELERLIEQAVDECGFPLLGERSVHEYARKLATQAELITWADQGRLGAFVALYGNDAAGKDAFISMVVVARPFRGRGLAAGLVGAALSILRSRGFARCRLQVHRENASALRMYERMDFRKVDDSGQLITMELPL